VNAVRNLVCLSMICSGLVLVQAFVPTAAQNAPSPSATAEAGDSPVDQLRREASGSVLVERTPATKAATFIRASAGGDLLPANHSGPVDKAAAFLRSYGALLGVTDPGQLAQTSRHTDEYGTTVTYRQSYRGVPVFAGTIKAHLDEQGDLTAVNGTAVPSIDLSTTPRLNKAEIGARAVRYVRSDPPTSESGKAVDISGLRAASVELLVYREGLIRGVPGETLLVYGIEVTNDANVRDMVFLNANNGKVVNRYSMIHAALDRKLYEVSGASQPVWEEGDPFPGGLNDDQQGLVLSTGESYQFFLNTFGYDSYDGEGATMRTVNNDPGLECPNASWDNGSTNYCDGVTADDVVAHEWGHAYTEYTSNLIYQWQPGALNESYSDIWGETVDLINARQDEDEGDITAKRVDGQCASLTPALPVVEINSPANIAMFCPAGGAEFGPPVSVSPTTGDVVLARDPANAAGPLTTDACSPINNGAAVSGNVALVDRGTCDFVVKAKNAQEAGATAVVVGNNNPDYPFTMTGDDPTITIPAVMITRAHRDIIVDELATATVNVTIKVDDRETGDSTRWLVCEDCPGFGVDSPVLRDMWNPTCVSDPGKVSDAQYICSTEDGGGVHSNSGVPNHGFALLVDGGTYNGIDVPSIGLTAAAHIYWRAQTAYQTESSGFPEHADALEASCSDLLGEEVRGLSAAGDPLNDNPGVPTAADTIEQADCDAIAAMARAVELREPPVRCDFQPLLAKNPPANPCGPGTKAKTIWTENFEDGLDRWALASETVFPGATTPGWRADDIADLPGGRQGTAAYGPDPDGVGSCTGDANDISGVSHLTSPRIRIDGSFRQPTRLTFTHYVATELAYDGGNIKLSVNGDAFDLIPAPAYTYNQPTTIATVAEGNTSPLAGQNGFTGTDGGLVTGSWGQSQINLTGLGVRGGDIIRLRFDMGRDGCGGRDGWYVDNIKVSTCKGKTKVTALQSPRPSRFGDEPRVVVRVDSLGGLGKPAGRVAVETLSGRVVGRGEINNGKARVFLPKRFPVGRRVLEAIYPGSGIHVADTDRFVLRVVKAPR
jgi:Zn-dependent metalloprotease